MAKAQSRNLWTTKEVPSGFSFWLGSWLWQAGATLGRGVRVSHCSDFSCCTAQALRIHRLCWLGQVGSGVVVYGL